jgi:hypothetical protein
MQNNRRDNNKDKQRKTNYIEQKEEIDRSGPGPQRQFGKCDASEKSDGTDNVSPIIIGPRNKKAKTFSET